eukprot:2823412-Pyramimonas_sp.AAC.1
MQSTVLESWDSWKQEQLQGVLRGPLFSEQEVSAARRDLESIMFAINRAGKRRAVPEWCPPLEL